KKLSGPPAKQAKQDGKWTKAAEGFARKAGVPLEALQIEGDRVVVEQHVGGHASLEALPPILERIIRGIPFRKSMRWDSLETDAFARPVHWIAATLDGKPLEVKFADVSSAPKTRGHRFAAPGEFPLPSARDYTKVRDPAVSRRGYERVLRARLSDGKFFFDEDRKVPLRSRLEKLGRRTFLQGLGTELERVQRLRELSLWLHGATGRGDPRQLAEAAELCKADLTTGMVGEFPELQGAMGRIYAL